MPVRAWWPAFLIALLVGCSKTPQPPQQPPPSGERITGNERIGWTQQATDSMELADFKYAIYVDGARSTLNGVSCATTATSAGFDCSAPLPKMSAGAHALEMAAYIDNGGTTLESPRSAPLQVIVSSGATAASRSNAAPLPATLTATTADGVRLKVDVLVAGLDTPTDIAFAPDGRLFVAERDGHIRIVRDDAKETPGAPPVQLDPDNPDDPELLAIALDPHYDTAPFVYAVSAVRGPGSARTFVLARFREAHGTFGDRAVLLSDVPASDNPAASIRFGPDRKMYVALDDGGADAGDLAAFNGKILRMNRDGTTPDDQSGGTPVYSYEYRSPRGFDWQPGSDTIWIADGTADGTARLVAVGSTGAPPRRASTLVTYSVPGLAGASSAAFYRGDRIPAFRSDLFIAAADGQHLLRIRFDSRNPTRVIATERLLQGMVGPIRVVFVRADGAIYVATSHELLRVSPIQQ
jgi:aldose sugar dehydrogenase